MYRALAGAALAALLVLYPCVPAGASEGITGTITRVEGRTLLVESEPEERSGSDKSYVEVGEGTQIRAQGPAGRRRRWDSRT